MTENGDYAYLRAANHTYKGSVQTFSCVLLFFKPRFQAFLEKNIYIMLCIFWEIKIYGFQNSKNSIQK